MDRLTPEVMAVVWPGAEKLSPDNGSPPAMAVYNKDGRVVGYVFSTLDVVHAPGFSGIPFDVIAGTDLTGHITGSKVIFQRDPHLDGDTLREGQLDVFLTKTAGLSSQDPNPNALQTNFVAGASMSARMMRDAVFDSAQLVLIGRGLAKAKALRPTGPVVNVDGFTQMSWRDLLAGGEIVHKVITGKDVAAALGKADPAGGKLDVPSSDPASTYIDIYTGLATPAAIGKNVLGDEYSEYFGPRGKNMRFLPWKIFVASKGPYDFLDESGANRFDRLRVVQGDRTYQFSTNQYQWVQTGGRDGIRALDHAAVLTLPVNAQFDPLKPWRLELLVNGQTATGSPVSLAFPVDYQLPASHVLQPPPPAWVLAWSDSRTNIFIELALLAALTLILVFQTKLVQSRRAHRIIRNSFLLFVLVWEGWIAGGQLSIVHIVNYIEAPFRNFDLGFYLAEPLIALIVIYTAVSLVLIGRGVFCGWLCPFGALQELLAQTARFIGLPQWNPPESVQKYLWLGKYVSLGLVLGLAAFSIDMSSRISEVEPFDTAITSHFVRAWPYVFYSGALLVIGLFSERAFCRYLCPLGGVLALGDRLHLVDVLKRRPECGSPCRLCESSCPVKAISRSGKIKTAECFQCLDCQVEYYDDHRCPPLVAMRKRVVRPGVGSMPLPAGAVAAADRV